MKIKYFLAICLILILSLSVSAISAAEDSDYSIRLINDTVDDSINTSLLSTSDEDALGDGEGSFTNLANEINAAGGSLTLTRDYIWQNGDPTGGIVISSSIQIIGNGHSIDAGNSAKIFNIEASDVQIQHLTLINGYSQNGGAISVTETGTNFIIQDSTFLDNVATDNGGAISSNAFNTRIINNEFIHNRANTAGALQLLGQSAYVIDCIFKNNSVNSNAGAILFNGARSYLYTCDFINNSAMTGGAVLFENGAEYSEAKYCTFENNTASGNGGALFWSAYSGTLYNSTFKNNSAILGGAVKWDANAGIADKVIFELNRGTGDSNQYGGGAIIWGGNDGKIANSTFNSNTAINGGAVDSNQANLVIFNSTFYNNTANQAGAIFVRYGDSVKVIKSTFTQNKGTAVGGGAIRVTQSTDFLVENSTFTNNTSPSDGGAIHGSSTSVNAIIRNSTFTLNNAQNFGGAVYWAADSLTLDNATFDSNRAVNGGAVSIGNSAYTDGQNSVISNSVFKNNNATNGAGVYWISANGKLLNNTFSSNNATGIAGAVYGHSNAVNMYIFNNTFENNNGGAAYSGSAGAIYWDASSLTVNQSTFSSNHASNTAGAIYGTSNAVDTVLFNNTFENNRAISVNGAGDAGAIYWEGNNLLINESIFTENYARLTAGAVYLNGLSSFTITKSNFTKNVMDINQTYRGGAAIYIYSSSGKISFSLFEENDAKQSVGGAVFSTATVYLINDTFNRNNASQGGAVYATAVNINIYNSTFAENTASSGGAVYGKAYISKSEFNENEATNGGAIYLINNNYDILNSTFYKNTAIQGGAIYLDNWGNGKILNSVFDYNTAVSGGAIYMDEGAYLINNTEFAHNSADDGGALYTSGYQNKVTYSSFTYNVASQNGGAVYWEYDGTVYRDYNHFNYEVRYDDYGRWTWERGSARPIENSTFYNNIDYLMNVTATTYRTSATITVNVPKDALGSVTIKVTNQDDQTAEITNGVATAIFNNLESGHYFVTAIFSNEKYLEKRNTTSFDIDVRGDFTILQGLINDAISAGKTELNLTRNYTFTYILDDAFKPQGMVINSPITINGNGFTINALEECRIFHITSPNVVLNNIAFTEGKIAGIGGAVYYDTTDGKITNCKFVDNTASDGYSGGALALANSNHYVANCTFNDNIATGNGGAVYVTSQSTTIYNSTFNRNEATGLDGVEGIGGAIYYNARQGNIIDSTFVANVADNGGALALANYNTKLTNSTFIKNNASDNGGAVYITGASVIVNKSTINENHAINGGGIFVVDGASSAIIYNSKFTSNNASNKGGAIDWNATIGSIYNSTFTTNVAINGGAVFVGAMGGQGKIINSTFIGNNATNRGGAVDWNASSGDVEDSTFESNTAVNGGAIFVGARGTGGKIINSTFNNNKATNNGGAIDWFASAGDVEDSRFYENSAVYGGAIFVGAQTNNGKIINSTFESNHASLNGGAIDWNATKGTLANSTFTSNTAVNGGAVFVGAKTDGGDINNCTFTGNLAYVKGGAVDWNASSGRITLSKFYDNLADYGGAVFVGSGASGGTITYSTFKSNTAYHNGGAIDWNASSGILENSNFTQNSAQNGGAVFVGAKTDGGKIYNSIFILNTATVKGGAVDWNASSGDIENSNFTQNSAQNGGAVFVGAKTDGGKIYNSIFILNTATVKGGAVDWNATTGNLIDSKFYYNNAQLGGAVFVGSSTSTGHIKGSLFDGNTATVKGGAVDWNATSGVIEFSTFNNNSAEYGGAVFVGSASDGGKIINSTFTNNKAKSRGGAVDWNASSGDIENSTFDKNSAPYGGAVFVGSSASGGYIVNSNFTNNLGNIKGGAVDWNASTGHIVKSYFDNNTANYGGAVFVGSATDGGKIINSTFKNNVGYQKGGAIDWNASSGYVLNSEFYGNRGKYGGAVYVGSATDGGEIINSTFKDNYATNNGGAVDWNGSAGDIENSTFENNMADNGGAVFVGTASENGKIINSTFINNYASDNGGAVDWNASSGDIEKSKFIKNEAKFGGAVFVGSATDGGKILNSTFTGNYATNNGGAVDWNGTSGDVENSRFYGNYAAWGGAIFVGGHGQGGNVINSTFDGNAARYNGGAVDWNGTGGTVKDSKFYNNNADEIHGGAIFVGAGGGEGTVENSEFINNTANLDGGAIYWRASSGDVEYSIFDNNKARNGGAIFVDGATDHGIVFNSTFTNNRASVNGGAIDWNASSGTVNKSVFTNNVANYGGAVFVGAGAEEGQILNSKFNDNIANKDGGAIILNNLSDAKVINSSFNRNSAENGGAIYTINSTKFLVNNSQFNENKATYDAGAIYWKGTNGILENTNFTSNEAGRSAGAVLWNGTNGKIYRCEFTSNRALDKHGGAVLWIASEGGSIINSTFTLNSAVGNGGAVLWEGDSGELIANSTFKSNTAENGGAIEWYDGENGKIINAIFEDNVALVNGGAIYGYNNNNAVITNSTFKRNRAAGKESYNPAIVYGDGGAIGWSNSNNLQIANSTFDSNHANSYAGAVYGYITNATLFNLTFTNNSAANGGAITWSSSDNLSLNRSTFDKNNASFYAGALYLYMVNDAVINNTDFKNNMAIATYGGAVDINGGKVTIDKSTFDLNSDGQNRASAILVQSGTAYINNSDISGENPVWIVGGAAAYLTRNTITDSAGGEYSVLDEGDLYLDTNEFDNVIIDAGNIHTQTYTTVLENKTYAVVEGNRVILNATIKDDNGNDIVIGASRYSFYDKFTGNTPAMSYYEGIVSYGVYDSVEGAGYHTISGVDWGFGLLKNDITPGTLIVKGHPTIIIKINQTNEGEIVKINATISPDTIEGEIKFTVDGNPQNVTIKDGVANITLTNVTAGVHTVVAYNNGTVIYVATENSTTFTVNLRPSSIKVEVKNVSYGENSTAIATVGEGMFGYVTFIFNNIRTVVEIKDGSATLDLGKLDVGDDYSIFVVFEETKYFKYNYNDTVFKVNKINTTIEAIPLTPIELGANEVITVTINNTTTGFVMAYINGQNYSAAVNNGMAKINISGLAIGTYEKIVVRYIGDNHFNENQTTVTFVISSPDGTFTALQHLIDNTPANGVLVLNRTYTYTHGVDDWLGDGGVKIINHPITINGNGNILNADGYSRIFTVTGGNIVLNNLTYINGKSSESGAISATGINFTFANSTFVNNTGVDGGALSIGDCTNVTIINDKFENNIVTGSGGAIYLTGGLNTTIKSAEFINNTAEGNGGAIYVNQKNVIIDNAVFEKNSAKFDGGAIILTGDNNADISNAEFINNTATVGSAIKNSGDLSLTNVSLFNNKADSQEITITPTVDGRLVTVDVRLTVHNNLLNGIHTDSEIELDNVSYYGLNGIANTDDELTSYPVNQELVIEIYDSDDNLVRNITSKTGILGNVTLSLDDLDVDTYAVKAYHPDNSYYTYVENIESFEVEMVDSQVNLTAVNVTYPNSTTISVNVTSGATGEVMIYIDGELKGTITLNNSKGSIVVGNLKAGNYTVNAVYGGDVNFNGNENTTSLEIVKANLPVNVEAEAIVYGNNATIVVYVPTTGNVTIKVNGNEKEFELKNGKAEWNITGLAVGSYPVEVTFKGNDNYTKNTASAELTVNQAKPNLTIEVGDLKLGESTTVTVRISDNATGNVTVYIGGKYYNLTVRNGEATKEISGLTTEDYSAAVTYAGDKNYTESFNSTTFKVSPTDDFTIDVSALESIVIGQNNTIVIILPVSVSGEKLEVNINGTRFTPEIIKGIAKFNYTGVAIGKYVINVTYAGNENYTAKDNNSTSFTVTTTASYNINLTVDVRKYGDKTTFAVEVPKDIGSVNLRIDEKDYTVSITDGAGSLTLSNLSAGLHRVNASYAGDDKYSYNENITSITVPQTAPSLTVTADAVDYNSPAIITVKVAGNETGKVFLTINGTVLNKTVDNKEVTFTVNGLNASAYPFTVYYEGDNNYTDGYAFASLTVNQITPTLVINVNESYAPSSNVKVNVTIDRNATGYINIIVNGADNIVEITDGEAVLEMADVKPGDYTIEAKYLGDNNYKATSLSETFKVAKFNTTVEITDISIDNNNNVTVTVKVNSSATGDINITIDSKTYNGTVNNGMAAINIGTYAVGDHTFTANYTGDDTFNDNKTTYTFTVPALVNYTLPIRAINITYSKEEVITVTLPDGFDQSKLTIKINDVTQEFTVEGNAAIVRSSSLASGTYTASATYGDDSYASKTNSTVFKVSQANATLVVKADNIKVGQNATINISSNFTGKITLYVNGTKYEITVTGGVGQYNTTGLGSGDVKVLAIFDGNTNYTAVRNTTNFSVSKNNVNISANATNGTIGDDVTIKVNLTGDATGGVVVEINGVMYYANVTGGIATIIVPNLNGGVYTAKINYTGDYKYLVNYTDVKFNLSATANYDIGVGISSVKVGENALITVVLPHDINGGDIIIRVNGTPVPIVSLTNGIATAEYYVSSHGTYEVNVTYGGDNKYLPKDKNGTRFTAGNSHTYNLIINVYPNKYGEDTLFVVNLPSDVSNNVTLLIEGDTYSIKPNNGRAELTLNNLSAGNHEIRAIYGGDTEYSYNSNSTKFTVPQDTPLLNVSVEDIKVGQAAEVTVKSNVNGTVIVYVNGTKYNVEVRNGHGSFNVDSLNAGKVEVLAIFDGNVNYTGIRNTTSFTVSKNNVNISANATNVTVGSSLTIKVNLTGDATGGVVADIGGVKYYANITNGVATITVSNLNTGVYTAKINYTGDYKYLTNYTEVKFNVSTTSDFTIDVDASVSIMIGENNTITITLPGDIDSETLTVNINGTIFTPTVRNGVAVVNYTGTASGSYMINVTYVGNSKYSAKYNNGTIFAVTATSNYNINLTVDANKYGDKTVFTVEVPDDIGSVIIEIGEKEYSVAINSGQGSLELSNLSAGSHNVKASYEGDVKYAYMENSTTFEIPQATPSLTVTADAVDYNSPAVITVKVAGNESGKIFLTVNGTTLNRTIDNNEVTFTINGLNASAYPFTVYYEGDINYTDAYEFGTLSVNQITPTLDIVVNETYDPNANVKVNVTIDKNATGYINIAINGADNIVKITNGAAVLEMAKVQPGDYAIEVRYLGDNNYKTDSESETFKVAKFNTTVEIMEVAIDDDNNVTVSVKVNSTATGDINITIDGKTYNASLDNGMATINIGVYTKGDHTFIANYTGDNNFNYNKTEYTFTVSELVNYNLPIEATGSDYGGTVTVRVTLPSNDDSNLAISINDVSYTGWTLDSNVAVLIVKGLKADSYTAKATFSDDSHAEITNSTVFAVSQINPALTIIADAVDYNSPAIITVKVAGNETGKIFITINGTILNKTVDNKEVRFTVNGLNASAYPFTVYYGGDNNYTDDYAFGSLTVNRIIPTLAVDAGESYAPNSDIKVNVTIDKNATGYINIIVNGVDHIVKITEGKAVLEIAKAQPGDYTVKAEYLGDNNYKTDSKSETFKVDKFNTTVEIAYISIDDNNNVTVTVKVNSSATGDINITMEGKTYNGTLNSGTAVINIGVHSTGEHSFVANYTGDDNFNDNKTTYVFNVPILVNYRLPISAGSIDYGGTVTVRVTLPSNDDSNLAISINDVSYTGWTLDGNVAVLTVKGLKVGSYTVKATFHDDTYAEITNSTVFAVSQISSGLTVSADAFDYNAPAVIKVEVSGNETGKIFLTVNGTTLNKTIENGEVVFTVKGLNASSYPFTVYYEGDTNYTDGYGFGILKVNQITPTLDIVVNETYAPNANVKVNVSIDKNATGYINIIVNGEDHVVKVTNDEAVYEIIRAQPGDYTVKAEYLGDNNYRQTSENAVFNVAKFNTTIEVTTEVGDDNDVVITVKVNDNATSTVTIKINGGNEITEDVVGGIAVFDAGIYTPGSYDVDVRYDGDSNFNENETSERFEVPLLINYDLPIYATDITYGGAATISVTLPAGAIKENLTIKVNDKEYEFTIEGNIATVTIPSIAAGTYTCEAIYAGDSLYSYKENSTVLEVKQAIANLTVKVADINIDDNATVKLESNFTGKVTVYINGTKYEVNVNNGHGSVNITNLTPGKVQVLAIFDGNTNYTAVRNTTNFTVSKYSTPIELKVSNINVGDNEIINITLNGDVAGVILVDVSGIGYYVNITSGKANLTLTGLKNGSYNVNAVFLGNDKYLNATANKSFEVTKVSEYPFDAEITVRDGNLIINLTAPDDATGLVNITIDNYKNYTVSISNGTIANITGLRAGNHTVNITYLGDDKYGPAKDNGTARIPSVAQYDLPLFADDITVGEPETIIVIAPQGATGFVNITVGTELHVVSIVDGEAILRLNNLTTGQYSILAEFENDVYGYKSNSTIIFVHPISDYRLNVTAEDIKVGETAHIIIKSDVDKLNVSINGKTEEVKLTGGQLIYDVPDLASEYYTVVISHHSDNYTFKENSTRFGVFKLNTTVSVQTANITFGEYEIINVTISDNAEGIILIDVNGTGYYTTASNGQAQLKLTKLANGNYTVTVSYLGSGKYNGNTTSAKFTVKSKNTTTIDIKINETTGNVTVILPENATGNVTIIIDGKNYNYTNITNNTIIVNNTVLEPGNHTIEVIYSGDGNFTNATNSTVIEVPKIDDYLIIISGSDIVVGQIETLEIELSVKASGIAVVDVGGVGYYVNITDGKGSLKVDDLKVGNYTAFVTYLGDGSYANKSNFTKFEVINKIVPDIRVDVNVTDGTVNVTLPENATGNVTVIIDGKIVNITNITNTTVIVNITNVTPGNHTIEVIYSGDGNFTNATNSTVFEVPKIDDYTITVTGRDIVVGQTEILKIELSVKASGIAVVDVGGVGYYTNITEGKGTLIIPNLDIGKYISFVTYLGDGTYNNKSNSTKFVVSGKTTPTETIDINTTNGTIEITLPENATGNITVIIDGNNYTVVNVTNKTTIINITNVTPGNHTVEVIYSGDGNYTPATNSTTFEIPKIKEFTLIVEASDIYVGNRAIIKIILPDDSNGVVLIDVGGVGYYVNVTKGHAQLEVPNLHSGEYPVHVKYLGDEKYDVKENTTKFNVLQQSPSMNVTTRDASVGGDAIVKIELPGDATGNVTVTVGGKNYTADVNDGVAIVSVPNLPVGNYTADVKYSGDDKYLPRNGTTNLNVNKITDYDIKINNTDDKLIITVPENATGNLTVNIDGKNHTVLIKDGEAVLDISDLDSGDYNVTVYYLGDNNYASKTNSSTIIISRNPGIRISAPDVVKYYSGPDRLVVSIIDSDGRPVGGKLVKITINGITYSKTTDNNGIASLALNLNCGNYTSKVEVPEYDYSRDVHVEVKPTIYANDIVKIFRNGTHYWALFVDGNGNPLANTNVSYNIHGVFYTRTTNGSGWCRLALNLEKGTYILTAINPVTGEMRTNIVTVISKIVENDDVVKYYKNDTQFSALILDPDGTPTTAGKEVMFNIHGRLYTRFTDETGHVYLNINIEPGDYIMTTYYEDCREGNSIKVLPTLLANDMEMFYGEESQFKATVLDGHGKAYANQEVTFNLQGVLYNRTTDENGDARLAVNLMPGEYIITSGYNGYAISNTIKVEA